MDARLPDDSTSENPKRDFVLGIHKRAWYLLPHLSAAWEANILSPDVREKEMPFQVPVMIDYAINDPQRDEKDSMQQEEKEEATFKDEFMDEFAISDEPEKVYVVAADVIRPLPE